MNIYEFILALSFWQWVGLGLIIGTMLRWVVVLLLVIRGKYSVRK